jgi:hypothetical protein
LRKIRLRKKKSKDKKHVDLTLEKDGKREVVRVETSSTLRMAKTVKKLAGFNNRGWKIVGVEGNDPQKVEMFKKVADGYVPTAGEALEFAGLPNVPKIVKKRFDQTLRSGGKTDGENANSEN